MEKIKIAYIGGGSRLWARNLMSDLALDPDLKGVVSLYDIVKEAADVNAVIGNKMMKHPDSYGGFVFESSSSLEECLSGSDFVFISILPGTFDEMEAYVHIPEKYGIYQSVGDTAGIAGIFRSLIAMPMFEEIALAIKKYSPNAWVINFTNPLTMCVRTLYHVFPEIKAFGNCHEVFGTKKMLAKVLKAERGIETTYKEIKVNTQGINHFTWFNKAFYKDLDVTKVFNDFVEKNYKTGFIDEEYLKTGYPFASSEKLKFDLFRKYGIIAAAGDRHLAEFFPNNLYLGNDNPTPNWGFYLTPVKYRKNRLIKDDLDAKEIAKGLVPVKLTPTDEEGVRQVRALLGLESFVTNVNMINLGQIPNLPSDSVVETNAYFWKDSVQPIFSGQMDEKIRSLTLRHINSHDLLIRALKEKDISYAFQALKEDLTVEHIDNKTLKKLFDEIVSVTKPYLKVYGI